jgi:hypothetical protein
MKSKLKRDIEFYQRTLTKRLVLLERHQNRDKAILGACKAIRAALDNPRSLPVMRALSRVSGMMLRAVKESGRKS